MKIVHTSLLYLIAVVLFGCSATSPKLTTPSRWAVSSIQFKDNVSPSASSAMLAASSMNGVHEIEFDSEGTLVLVSQAGPSKYSYTVEGSELTFNLGRSTERYEMMFSRDTLKLTPHDTELNALKRILLTRR